MQHPFVALALSALALSALTAAAAQAPPAALPRPDYLGLVERFLPPVDAAYTARSCGAATAKVPCNSAAELAAAHAALWETRGDAPPNATATARASQLMQWFVASWATATANGTRRNNDTYDFFACEPIAVAFRGLARLPGGLAGLGWSAIDAANARLSARDVCAPEMRGAWNQAASRAAGTAIALQVWPDLDTPDGSWRAYAETVLSDWTADHAHAENSPVYGSIFYLEALTLALELDAAAADADAAGAAAQSQALHWSRDLMGPGGFVPAFGDAWSGAGIAASQWGFEESLYWPAPFERFAAAAAAAGDAAAAAHLSYAAASDFAFGPGAFASADNLCDAAAPAPPMPAPTAFSSRSLRYALKAEEWRARGGGSGVSGGGGGGSGSVPAPQPPMSTTASTRRLPPAGLPAFDKLVLTPAVRAGGAAPYAVAELLATSALYHCHILQLGAVTNFVARNTTFIHHVGRDSYVAEAASIAVVWRDPANATGYPFPAPENFFHPGGAWRLLELPASNLQPVSQAPQDYFRKNLTQLHFFVRNSLASREAIELDVAYVAFVNPDSGATLVVDDFEHVPWTAPWPNATILSDASAPGPTHHFLRIACGPGTSTNSRPPARPPLQLEFDARDYPVLRLFYRVSANAPANDSGLVVIGHGPYTVSPSKRTRTAPPPTHPNR